MNGSRMTDQELTAAYETYRDMVYRIALTHTKNTAKAEDIQQDVFMALVRYSDRIRSEAHLKPWLILVTVNACRKHFRSLWIKLTVLYDDALMKKAGGGRRLYRCSGRRSRRGGGRRGCRGAPGSRGKTSGQQPHRHPPVLL